MSFSNITVGELRIALEHYSDDAMIIISKDGDGNYFSPLTELTTGHYIPSSDYQGDFVSDDEMDDDVNLNGARPSVVLWPAD